jgi:hypothetical protein
MENTLIFYFPRSHAQQGRFDRVVLC